jgi:DNA adenine methylase
MAPIVKWVGGKQKLLPRILPIVPDTFTYYYEPFLGGGSVLEAMLRSGKCTPGQVFASDLNPVLVALHQALKDDAQKLADEVFELLKDQSEERFYEIRAEYNMHRDPARFIYINKTGFNGLYRENKKGGCNVPWGHGQRVRFVPADYVALGQLYRQYDVQFKCCAWDEALEDVQEGSFVYCDPPYVTLSATAHFTSYTAVGFGAANTAELIARLVALRERARVLLSNHDAEVVTAPLEGWTFDKFGVNRTVSCKGVPIAGEVLARSY